MQFTRSIYSLLTIFVLNALFISFFICNLGKGRDQPCYPGYILYRFATRGKYHKQEVSLRYFPSNVNENMGTVPSNVIEKMGTVPVENESRVNYTRPITSKNALKKLLSWNGYADIDDYAIGVGEFKFTSIDCPVTCTLTVDKRDQSEADAVLIFPFCMKVRNESLPIRKNNQIFVFYLLESPMLSWGSLFDFNFNDFFNLTVSYMDHRDTDVHAPYGDIIDLPANSHYEFPDESLFYGKTNMVAWAVSNCDSPSQRLAYATELSKHIDVHISGKCGNYSCPRLNDYGYQCLVNITKNYLFYLAFENSYCTQYITEKFFATLRHNIVPVVYGGGDYSRFLPPGGYIDVRNFTSPKALAEYLIHLSKTPKEYLAHFEWKRTKLAMGDVYHREKSFCEMCRILNTPAYPYKSNFDIMSYWNPSTHCLKGETERDAVHI